MNQSEEIPKLQEELSLLKEKLKISQSLVKIGFWELNRLIKKITLSEEAKQILQIDAHDTLTIGKFAHAIGKKQFNDLNKQFADIGKDFQAIDFEFALQGAKNDNPLWIKVIANTTARSKQNPNIIMGIVQDITEQKRGEQQLLHAKERAEEADILKSAFLANMSHEIRTPLNAIVGFSKLLTNQDINNSQRNEYSEYITSSANNLLNLIRDIVDVSKIEAGKILIDESVCKVNEVLRELRFTFEREKENQLKSNIEIILNIPFNEENCAVKTDPYRFHQIMVNLIGNALKFIEKGYIEFGYMADNEYLQFYVKDTGIGIPEDKKDLIFSRFGQIINNKIKNPGGTGLGLSITKHLVERLGGRIWVDSIPGKGTTFFFTLPNKKPGLHEIKDQTKEDLTLKPEFGKLRILAVEDDQINMVLLEDTLNLYIKKISIEKATNGKEAIEKLQSSEFDLIIMDIRMPVMDGYDATDYIRNNFCPPKNKVPILGLSAHALKEEINKGKQIGMNDFLSKPITPEELISKINMLTKAVHSIQNTNNELKKTNPESTSGKQFSTVFLEEIFKNDETKIIKTLQAYIEQIPTQLNALQESIKTHSQERIKNTAHALKSTFKYLNRNDLSELAREIEFCLSDDNSQLVMQDNLNTLNKEWILLQSEIEKRVKKD